MAAFDLCTSVPPLPHASTHTPTDPHTHTHCEQKHEFSYGLRISLDDQKEQVLQAVVPCMAAWVKAVVREPLSTPAAHPSRSSAEQPATTTRESGGVVFAAPGHARGYAVGGDVLYRAYEVVTCSSAPPAPEAVREMSDTDWLAHDLLAGM